MDGGALLKKAKELHPKLKTILITGYDPEDVDGILKESNIDHFITKPVSMDSIHYALQTIDPE
jgi:YesN/AraC family two-component response regulator